MQKLSEELKNVPTNASQVCSSTNFELNKEKTSYPELKLSVQDNLKNNKLTDNNIEVNRDQQTDRSLKAKVFVLNLQGKPLMPCSYAKSKRMVKAGKAKVVKRFPFTIQLNFNCENKTQEINLGIDSGYQNIGFSATTKKEELICGTLVLDGKTKERLDERRMYRRGKRARHHWYRKPRFNNRKKKEGWLPPSIQRRYDTHLNLINKIKSILPISSTIIEVAKFDIQKLENPDIQGKEYQQGKLYNLDKVSYLRNVQNNRCLFCEKEFKIGELKALHHRFRKGDNRRTDRVNGLILLHKACHTKLHEKHKEKEFQNVKVNQYKQSIFMSIINKRFWKDISDLKVTYGNITSLKRNELGLEKTHFNDAFIISGGINQKRIIPIIIIQKHRNNRVLQLNRNGFKPSIKKEKSKVNPLDLFWVKSKQYTCKGMFSFGKYICYGSTKKKEYFKFSDITKVFSFGSLVFTFT